MTITFVVVYRFTFYRFYWNPQPLIVWQGEAEYSTRVGHETRQDSTSRTEGET
jgi:hypothetical protein